MVTKCRLSRLDEFTELLNTTEKADTSVSVLSIAFRFVSVNCLPCYVAWLVVVAFA